MNTVLVALGLAIVLAVADGPTHLTNFTLLSSLLYFLVIALDSVQKDLFDKYKSTICNTNLRLKYLTSDVFLWLKHLTSIAAILFITTDVAIKTLGQL